MLSFTSLRFGHRCCGPLSINVVALPLLAHELSVYLSPGTAQRRNQGASSPPSPPFILIDTAEVYCYM